MPSRRAHRADALRGAAGDRRVGGGAGLDGLAEQRLEGLVEPGVGGGAGELDQDVPVARLAERVARPGQVGEDEVDGLPVGDLERRQVHAGVLLGQAEQGDRGVDGRHGHPGRGVPRGGREEPQHGAGDDAERALRADEQLGEVVAGVVLAEPAQPVPHPAVGQHDLEAEHQLAGHAVAQHRGAAGVGREVAADGAAALGAQRHREEPVDLLGRRLHVGQHDAGVDGDGAGDRVDLAHAAHPAEGEHDLAARRVGHPAADQPGVAALRHDRHARRGAGRDDRGHLLGRARPDHREGPPGVGAGPVDDVRRDVGVLGQDVVGADARAQLVEQVVHGSPSGRSGRSGSVGGAGQPSSTATSSATGREARVVTRMVSRETSSPTR